MREIKFRAWVLGKMYEVKNLEWDWGHLIITTDGGWIALPDPKAHLMEFTGLHDKNGVEIYEGDVCVFDIFDTLTRYPDLNPFESYLVVIEWKHGAWGFRFLYPELVNEDDREWCAFWNSKDGEMWNLKYFRVIGNIHENPELLESPDA